MSDDETAGSSLLLARHDTAHREHALQHRYLHGSLHKKQEVNNAEDAVTEIVATISIIQQINVDINGNTLGIQTIQTHLSPAALAPAAVTEAPLPPVPEVPSLPPTSFAPSIPSEPAVPEPDVPSPPSSSAPEPLPPAAIPPNAHVSSTSSLDTTPVLTSSPSETTSFPSLIATANSTSILSSSSSFSQSYTNSSRTNASISYITTSSRSSSLRTSSSTTDLSSFFPVTSVDGGVVAAGTGSAPGGPQSTAAVDSGGGNDGVPPTPVVVGGVIGSLAGAAVLIVAILFVLRWRKRGRGMLTLGSGTGDERNESSSAPHVSTVGFTIPAAFASLTNKRFSQQRQAVESSPSTGEKGFYRVAGRKIPSVLQTGGDGYGGGIPHDHMLSGASFYRDSQGFYGGSEPPSPPFEGFKNRESAGGVPIFRPSPARTPTREESPFSFSPDGTPPRLPVQRPDVLGRSHASQDGSHTSRFTEEV